MAQGRSSTKEQGERSGAFTFVLHSHLPYCRLAGQWPHGEEWIHEALAETYIPLLNTLYDMWEQGVRFKLTLGVTPVLAEQLADRDILAHFGLYLEQEIGAARRDVERFAQGDDRQLQHLAAFYLDTYQGVRHAFVQRFQRDVIGALRALQDAGYVELITCAATHGYLPLLSRDSSIYAQLRTGVASYRRLFGREPRAIWLPECAYRPAYTAEDGTVRPALEEFLAPLGLTCFFVETHTIEGGKPVGKAAGDVAIGPYGMIKRQYIVPESVDPTVRGTTYEACYVVGNANGLTQPPVAAIGRNDRTGQQVWSAALGYPGDADYREFHKKDSESGLQYWRVTGPGVDLGSKDLYHPEWAEGKRAGHAAHYARLVEELLQAYRAESGRYGLIAANYDTELFGHWWFEGVEWLGGVLRELASGGQVELTTASEFLAARPPERVVALPESSWGAGGTHWTWDNDETHWVWAPIAEAERRMEALVARYPEASVGEHAVLNQAARELLLLEASDWPFLMTTGQAKEYATQRFQSHLDRFQRLAASAEQGVDGEAVALAEALYELDKVFPDIEYAWFAARQGRAQ